MLVSQLMSSNVIRILPEDSVEQAARLMAQHNIGVLPVCLADGALRGIITDRDIALRSTALDERPSGIPVRDVMSKSLVTVEGRADPREAAKLMGEHRIRRLPVMEGGRLTGMISLGDLARSRACDMETALALSNISSDSIEY